MFVRGDLDPRFNEVRDVFTRSLCMDSADICAELGGAVCVYINGEPVLDLWGGFANEQCVAEWSRDTIVCVQSVSKGVLATLALILIDRGLLDPARPIAHYWPEFAAKGKADITVAWALTHQSGLPAWEAPQPGMGYNWEAATAALADSQPDLVPGRDCAYHPYTFGFIVGEVVQRVARCSLTDFLHQEITGPSSIDFTFGAQPGDVDRVATFTKLRHGDNIAASSAIVPPKYSDVMRRAIDVLDHDEDYNSAAWRSAVIPAANGHTNARALARLYSFLANDGQFEGRQLLSKNAIERASALVWSGSDLLIPARVNQALGFIRNCPSYPAGPNPASFGHAGLGGAYGFADPEHRLAFGYTPNKLWLGETLESGKRCTSLIEAVYRCLVRS